MALCDRFERDIDHVFLNHEHFATWHTWNNKRFQAVTDEEEALKRKNNNVVDISWDNNSRDVLLYVKKIEFPGRAMPNEHGILDGRDMRIISVNEDFGMLAILMATFDPKAVAY